MRILLVSLLLAFLTCAVSCQPAHRGAATSHSPGVIASPSTRIPFTLSPSKGEHGSLRTGSATKQSPADEQIPRLAPIHFPTGSDIFLNEELNALGSNISWLQKNDHAVLVLEGHCDERGGDLYNMELGDRRARRVKSQLISKGIEADRLIMVVSYGEKQPVDPRHTPNAWNKNRRVEFIVR